MMYSSPRRFIMTVLVCGLALGMLAAALTGGCSKPVAQTLGHTFYFTWPGDDGMDGTCAGAEIRLSTNPVVNADTLSWWNAAPIRQGLPPPTPKVGGTRDSVEVIGLASQTHYYAIMKAYDEVPNWSGFSNLAEATTGDVIRPAPPQNVQGH